tara:strand:- start:3335 stop:3487 length:153 start_codon:yes stop_codon:yes gene_type:complete
VYNLIIDSLFFEEEHKIIQKMVGNFAKHEFLLIAKELNKNKSFPMIIVKK